ncbi:IS3 family transposase, partial [Escherichia coli]|nr:IS3 family transposase [Escherichia coli]
MIVLILVFRLVIGEQMIDVLGPEKRRRKTTQEKKDIIHKKYTKTKKKKHVARTKGGETSKPIKQQPKHQEARVQKENTTEQVKKASELAAAMT